MIGSFLISTTLIEGEGDDAADGKNEDDADAVVLVMMMMMLQDHA